MLGMIKGAAADRAGVRQGDEVLSVDDHDVARLSPFKVAGLLQGSGDDAAPSVSLVVRSCSTPGYEKKSMTNACMPRKVALNNKLHLSC